MNSDNLNRSDNYYYQFQLLEFLVGNQETRQSQLSDMYSTERRPSINSTPGQSRIKSMLQGLINQQRRVNSGSPISIEKLDFEFQEIFLIQRQLQNQIRQLTLKNSTLEKENDDLNKIFKTKKDQIQSLQKTYFEEKSSYQNRIAQLFKQLKNQKVTRSQQQKQKQIQARKLKIQIQQLNQQVKYFQRKALQSQKNYEQILKKFQEEKLNRVKNQSTIFQLNQKQTKQKLLISSSNKQAQLIKIHYESEIKQSSQRYLKMCQLLRNKQKQLKKSNQQLIQITLKNQTIARESQQIIQSFKNASENKDKIIQSYKKTLQHHRKQYQCSITELHNNSQKFLNTSKITQNKLIDQIQSLKIKGNDYARQILKLEKNINDKNNYIKQLQKMRQQNKSSYQMNILSQHSRFQEMQKNYIIKQKQLKYQILRQQKLADERQQQIQTLLAKLRNQQQNQQSNIKQIDDLKNNLNLLYNKLKKYEKNQDNQESDARNKQTNKNSSSKKKNKISKTESASIQKRKKSECCIAKDKVQRLIKTQNLVSAENIRKDRMKTLSSINKRH